MNSLDDDQQLRKDNPFKNRKSFLEKEQGQRGDHSEGKSRSKSNSRASKTKKISLGNPIGRGSLTGIGI